MEVKVVSNLGQRNVLGARGAHDTKARGMISDAGKPSGGTVTKISSAAVSCAQHAPNQELTRGTSLVIALSFDPSASHRATRNV